MKVFWLFFLLSSVPKLLAQPPEFSRFFADSTLRLDYYQAGNSDTSFFYFKELRSENRWAGSKTQLLDPFKYGEFMVHVYDSMSNQLIYSRGYSSLFFEWQTTDEATRVQRSFEESVLMPFPKNAVVVKLLQRNTRNTFVPVFSMLVQPENYFIHAERMAGYPVERLGTAGNPHTSLDIVILPDGYTAGEMAKFRKDAATLVDSFFTWAPFDKNRNAINFNIVLAPSAESGTDRPGENIWKNTILHTTFYTFNSERYLTTYDYHKVRDLAGLVPYDQIVILVNSEKYGGGGIYNFYSVCSSDNAQTEFVFMHEFGHAFASLADEYYTSETSYNEFFDTSLEPYQPNITTLVNFDSKWKDMLEPDTPVPTPATEEYKNKVGVFEGAGYVSKGIYRPTYNGSMKSAVINGFGPVNERAIQQMIDLYCQ